METNVAIIIVAIYLVLLYIAYHVGRMKDKISKIKEEIKILNKQKEDKK